VTDRNELARRFAYHPPQREGIAALHTHIREQAHGLAEWLDEVLPHSREKSLALTHLEETMMWSNAAVARVLNYTTDPVELGGPPATAAELSRLAELLGPHHRPGESVTTTTVRLLDQFLGEHVQAGAEGDQHGCGRARESSAFLAEITADADDGAVPGASGGLLPKQYCGNIDRHENHRWGSGTDRFWCSGNPLSTQD
jgi:hypothetical protein